MMNLKLTDGTIYKTSQIDQHFGMDALGITIVGSDDYTLADITAKFSDPANLTTLVELDIEEETNNEDATEETEAAVEPVIFATFTGYTELNSVIYKKNCLVSVDNNNGNETYGDLYTIELSKPEVEYAEAAAVADLSEQIDMLLEAVTEMSAVIYAE